MPSTITPAATWTGVIPTPDDAEGATGAGLDGFAQPLANREEYLKALLDAGVKRIQLAANVGALTALSASSSDQDVAIIPSVGLYIWIAAATTTVDGMMVVAGVGAPPAPGRWLLQGVGWEFISGYGGTPRVAGIVAGKVGAAYIPNGLIGVFANDVGSLNATYTSTASATYTATGTVAGVDITGVLVGDTIVVTADFGLQPNAASPGYARARLAAIDDTAGTPTPVTYDRTAVHVEGTTQTHWISRTVRHIAVDAGTTNVRIQLAGNGADLCKLIGPISLVARQYRA